MDFGKILDYKSYDQVCKYASMLIYSIMQLWKYERMQVCKYVSMHIYASIQVCIKWMLHAKQTKLGQILDSKSYDQVCKYASMQVCKYTNICT